MKVHTIKPTILITLLLLTASCGTGPALEEKSNSDASTNVAAGAANVDVNSGFTLEFSVAASTTSVNASTFFVVPMVSASPSIQSISTKSALDSSTCNPANALAGTISPASTGSCVSSYTLNPDSPLEYETEYALCVTSGVSFCNPNVNGFFSGLMERFTTVENGAAYTVGGTIGGLSGTVVLQNNAGDDLTLTEIGAFTFSTAVADTAAYDVTVKTNPDGQICTASNNSGTIDGANITDVIVTCSTNSYAVGGTVSGLSGTVVLQNNASDDLIIDSNENFTFATEVADGGGYAVTVKTNPDEQVCVVASGAGIISGANVTNVTVTCTTNTYSVGGTLSGLDTVSDLEVILQNNGGDDLTLDANGAFEFSTELGDGDAYAVTISTQPYGQTCHVTNGTGTIGGDVTDVEVYCAYFAYVTNSSDDTVSVIDTTNNTVFGDAITGLGDNPSNIALKPDGSTAYVSNRSASNSVSVIDTATNEVTETITGFSEPIGVAVSPDGTELYVANASAGSVSIYDITGSPVKLGDDINLGGGSNPQNLAFMPPNGSKVYVGTYGNVTNLAVIDTSTRNVTTINLLNNAAPADIAFTPDGSLAYVTRPWRNSIAKINTATETTLLTADQIAVSAWPGTPAVSPDGAYVYVPNTILSIIQVSNNTVIDTIAGFSGPSSVAFSSDGSIAYITNSGGNTVSIVNTTTREIDDTITVGNGANKIALQRPNPNP